MSRQVEEKLIILNDKSESLSLVHIMTEVDSAGFIVDLRRVNYEECEEGHFFSYTGYCFPVPRENVVEILVAIHYEKNDFGEDIPVREYFAVVKEY